MLRAFRVSYVVLLTGSLVGVAAPTVHGIVNGTPDEDRRRGVASACLKVTEDSLWSCVPGSGTLVGPNVMVSVAHARPFLEQVRPAVLAFSFEPVHSSEPGDLPGSVRPISEPTHLVAAFHAHPLWDPANTSNPLDVGVFILETPVQGVARGRLPRLGLLDRIWHKHNPAFRKFTIVGYGLSEVDEPLFDSWNERRFATTTGTMLHSGALLTAATEPGEGVGCFGDSGSPAFYRHTRTVVGVGSYVVGQCDQWAYSRLDTEGALSFLAQFVKLQEADD